MLRTECRGHCFSSFHKKLTRAEVPFHESIIGTFMVYQDRLETHSIFAAVRTLRNFRRVFYNFCYYFWSSHCRWTETSSIDNDFLFFKLYIALNSSTAPLQTFRCVPQLFTLSETIVFISSAMADQRMRWPHWLLYQFLQHDRTVARAQKQQMLS